MKKLKEWLPVALSIAAFALSIFNFYTTGLRVTDDLRAIAGKTIYADPAYKEKQFEIYPETRSFTFINAGMRSGIISGMELAFAQPQETRDDLPHSECNVPSVYAIPFSIDRLVLKPGDIVIKSATLVGAKNNIQTGNNKSVIIPFSRYNRNHEKVLFRICMNVYFSTPSIERGKTTIDEFEDELDPSIMGYGTISSYEIPERRPIQIIKRSGIVLFD